MTILKVTYGNPVASIKGICEHYQISDRTARMIVKELEQERGRYGDYTVLGDGALKRVNFLAPGQERTQARTSIQSAEGSKKFRLLRR